MRALSPPNSLSGRDGLVNRLDPGTREIHRSMTEENLADTHNVRQQAVT